MADLAASAVTEISGSTYRHRLVSTNRELIMKRVSMALTGQGDASDEITASALGFTKILFCTAAHDVTNSKVYPATIEDDEETILLGGGASNAYSTVTGTVEITVIGY